MRSKNAIRNLTWYLAYEAIAFTLGVVFPHFLIKIYGSEINGLTSTITRVLALINLIQAGAVGAAIYQMYKPVAEGDYETQSSIILSSKRFYNKISIIFFLCSLAAGLFYSFYIKSDVLKWWEILISFLILSANGAAALLITSISDIFLSPHQKKYYLIISQFFNLIVHYGLLVIVLIMKLHFVFIYVSILAGGCINILLNYVFYKKHSKNKITNHPINKNYIIPNKKYLMLQCIGEQAITAAPTIIITTILGLSFSSVFSIYFLVFTSVKTILSSIQLSFSAIFGNLVKTSSNDKIYRVYDCIELITILLGTIAAASVGFLIMPFIGLYTSGVNDINYLYPLLGIFTAIYVIVFAFRTSFSYVATVYGLFKKTCYITLFCSIIGIGTSILGVYLFGMPFAMIGLLLNELVASIATIYVLRKNVPWFNTKKLFFRTLLMITIAVLSIKLYFSFYPSINDWFAWIAYAFLIVFAVSIILLFYCLFFEGNSVQMFLNYLKNIFNKKKE